MDFDDESIGYVDDIIENSNGLSIFVLLLTMLVILFTLLMKLWSSSPKLLIAILTIIHMEVSNYHHGSCFNFSYLPGKDPLWCFIFTDGVIR